jgi:hypothetical protein
MAGTNDSIIDKACKDYKKAIFNEVEKRCKSFCDDLCLRAIEFRKSAPGKHDFTGNLLTSIVVCLYRNGRPVYACYAGDSLSYPIQVKMTAPKKYHFKVDYEGAESHYTPSVKTDEGWGPDDAVKFFQSYRPEGKNLFDIVVAYPVEYASWVEKQRSTTGILQTYAYAERVGTTFLGLPRAA